MIMCNKQYGFSLVEMAVVLVILGLILAGLLLPLSAQIEQRNRAETLTKLEEAKEALIGYALGNRFLPCPDSKAIPDGLEDTRNGAGVCPQAEGTLPWRALGVERTDAWVHYFRYRVDPDFSNNITRFGLSSIGNIIVNGESGAILTSNAVAALVSHGANGFGSKSTLTTSPANDMPAPTSVDEIENTTPDGEFVSRTPSDSGSVNEFDDLIIWLPQNLLVSRMVQAEQLP